MQDRIKDLVKYRLEGANEDLEAARILHEKEKYKQSCNRSYYAIFHSIRALIAIDKYDSKKHSGIISFFVKNYIKAGKFDKEFSKIVIKAERKRNKSDYKDFVIISKEESEEQLNNSEKFILMVEGYIKKSRALEKK